MSFNDIFDFGSDVPSIVFKSKFKNYAFFDFDVAASDEFLSGVQGFVLDVMSDEQVIVLSSGDGVELGTVPPTAAWPEEIWAIVSKSRSEGRGWGVSLIGASGEWAVYQKYPISFGVLGWNFDGSISGEFRNYVFLVSDIQNWLRGDVVAGWGGGADVNIIRRIFEAYV